MKRIISIAIILLFINSCDNKEYYQEGKLFYESGDYRKAIENF